MAFILADNVLQTSTTGGTGNQILISPAPTGYQEWTLKLNAGSTTFYAIWDDDHYEVGLGTFQTGPDRLVRTTVYSSDSTPTPDTLVNFIPSGTLNVGVALPGFVLNSLLDPALPVGLLVKTALSTYTSTQLGDSTPNAHITWANRTGVSGDPTPSDANIEARFARKDIAQTIAGQMRYELDVRMENTVALRALNNGGGSWLNLATSNASDNAVFGHKSGQNIQQSDGLNELKADYTGGGGLKTIYHEGNLVLFNDLVDGGPDYFESTPATLVVSAGNGGEAHGLASRPRLIVGVLRCVTPNNGYATGDEVLLPMSVFLSGANNTGTNIWADTTDVYFRCGTVMTIIVSAATGSSITITPSQWEFFIRAWR